MFKIYYLKNVQMYQIKSTSSFGSNCVVFALAKHVGVVKVNIPPKILKIDHNLNQQCCRICNRTVKMQIPKHAKNCNRSEDSRTNSLIPINYLFT